MKNFVMALVGIAAAIFIAQTAWGWKTSLNASRQAEHEKAQRIIDEVIRDIARDGENG